MAGCRRWIPAAAAGGDDVKRSAGLTLVEILVAMLLVLAVLAGSLAFVARGRAAQRVGESLARIEEALDAAFVVLVDEIRLAGYLGLAPPASAVDGASAIGTPERPDLAVGGSCGASLAHDLPVLLFAVDAAYQAAAGLPLGCRPGPDGRHATHADTLVVRHAAPEASLPEAGRLQLETNLRAAILAADGAARLGADARWHDLEVGVYYIGADSTGRVGWPSLRRKRLVGGSRPAFQDEELVSGIADMQIEFGLDDPLDADTAVDRWIAPGSLPAGAIPRALRLELEAWSDIAEPSQTGSHRRKRVRRVVELRNGDATP
jgi:type IV pilus assembly protein PilW